MINVLIADDHALLAESLGIVLQNSSSIKVSATVYNGREAVERCKEVQPDVVLMDIKMPEMDGVEAARMIKDSCPETKVIILTSLEDSKYILSSLIKGADAYLLKDTPPDRLKVLIECVYWGFYVLSGSTKQLLRDEILNYNGTATLDKFKAIKNEDIEIIRYISEGKSNNEIGRLLGYAEGTIKNKITKLLDAAGVDSRAQLVMSALKNNLI